MHPRVRWLLATILLGASIANAAADALTVIAAPGYRRTALSRLELAQIFRSKVDVDADGRRIVPVNLAVGHPAREAFSVAVLGRTPQQLQSYWNEQYFHGKKPPLVLDSEEAVIRFVASTPGAIGYVFDCAVDDRVQIVSRIPLDAPAQGAHECGHRAHE